MSAKKTASVQATATTAVAAAADNHISVGTLDSAPKVTTRLIFPGPVVLGTITSSSSVTSGTVSYRRLYATAGGDTTSDSATGSAVIPILR